MEKVEGLLLFLRQERSLLTGPSRRIDWDFGQGRFYRILVQEKTVVIHTRGRGMRVGPMGTMASQSYKGCTGDKGKNSGIKWGMGLFSMEAPEGVAVMREGVGEATVVQEGKEATHTFVTWTRLAKHNLSEGGGGGK